MNTLKKSLLIFISLLSINTFGQHYIGINYGLIVDESPYSSAGNSALFLYRGDLTKRLFFETGFGFDTHNAGNEYVADSNGQTYTKSLNLHTEYYRVPFSFNVIVTNPNKRFRFLLIAGCEIGLLKNAWIKESYVQTNLNIQMGGSYSYQNQKIESKYVIKVKNNSETNRFDLAYQIGGALDIDRVLLGAIRISFSTNKPTLKTFKNGSLGFIQNGNIYTGVRDGWLNIGLTYFIKIIDQAPFLINSTTKKGKNSGTQKNNIHF